MKIKIEMGFVVLILVIVAFLSVYLPWRIETVDVRTYTFSNFTFDYPGDWWRGRNVKISYGTKTRHDLSNYRIQTFIRKRTSEASSQFQIYLFEFGDISPRDAGVISLPLDLQSEAFLEYLYNELGGHNNDITRKITIANQIPAYHKEFFYPRIGKQADIVIFANKNVKYGLLMWGRTLESDPTVEEVLESIQFVDDS